MIGTLVYVLAREPRPGEVKTRLCPPLTSHQAAACHRAFLKDTLEALLGHPDHPEVILAAASLEGQGELARLSRDLEIEAVEQCGGDLGARMAGLVSQGLGQRGASKVLLLGADSPHFPLAALDRAVEALAGVPVVLGPSEDGGYYLFGTCRDQPAVFQINAAWGSAAVFEATRKVLKSLKLEHEVLQPCWDIDRGSDLTRLAAWLATSDKDQGLRHSRAVIAQLRSQGVEL